MLIRNFFRIVASPSDFFIEEEWNGNKEDLFNFSNSVFQHRRFFCSGPAYRQAGAKNRLALVPILA
ncbi:MAG: hypothetical protein WC435_00050 [Candidatus Paceibacterota bacterium]